MYQFKFLQGECFSNKITTDLGLTIMAQSKSWKLRLSRHLFYFSKHQNTFVSIVYIVKHSNWKQLYITKKKKNNKNNKPTPKQTKAPNSLGKISFSVNSTVSCSSADSFYICIGLLSLPIVQTLLLLVTFGYSLSSEAVVMRQLRRWKRLWRRSLTRSHKRTSMGPTRSCWNSTTSALQLKEITSKGTKVPCVYYQ